MKIAIVMRCEDEVEIDDPEEAKLLNHYVALLLSLFSAYLELLNYNSFKCLNKRSNYPW